MQYPISPVHGRAMSVYKGWVVSTNSLLGKVALEIIPADRIVLVEVPVVANSPLGHPIPQVCHQHPEYQPNVSHATPFVFISICPNF